MSVHTLLYRLGCLIHWPPRERAIGRGLRSLPPSVLRGARLIDVGSGLGQLSRVAREHGIDYLGLEPDDSLRQAASRDFPTARFLPKGAEDLGPVIGPADIMVLNGVAHHLPEPLFRATLEAGRDARAVILCDHLRLGGRTHPLARWLQSRDQGKFVRDYEQLREPPGLKVHSSEFFPIGPLGMPFWTYFCNVYLRP